MVNYLFLLPPTILANVSQVQKKNDFFVGRVERDVAMSVPSGEEFYNMVSHYDYIMFGF